MSSAPTVLVTGGAGYVGGHTCKQLATAGFVPVAYDNHGNPQKTPIPEDHATHPINPYGASKLMVEQMLQDFYHAYGLN